MPKRKSEEEDSRTQRKIKKLQKKLDKYNRKQLRTREKENNYSPNDSVVIFDEELSEHSALETELVEDLDEQVLMALGDCETKKQKYGAEIHPDIIKISEPILLEGLPKEKKEKITENMIIPSNCKLLDAPILNSEILGIPSFPQSAKTRDKLLQDRQQELGLAIANINETIQCLFKKDFDKLRFIKQLGDALRVLSNLHFQYTEIRRKLVSPFFDKNLLESLKDNKRSEYLFSNLEDSVKSFSAMKRASNVLKPKNSVTPKPSSSKNYQQPSRYQAQNQQQGPRGRGFNRGGHQMHYVQRNRHAFKPQDNRRAGPSTRGRAKYP